MSKLSRKFIRAISDLRFLEAQELIFSGADLHAKNDRALRLAVYSGHLEMVAFLLDHGANVHAQNDHALRWAVKHGQTGLVELLLERGANVQIANNLPLREAALWDHRDLVLLLLDHGADINAENGFALRWAVKQGHTKLVRLLLEHGADVHVENNRALRQAVYTSNIDMVRDLLKHGADVHAHNDEALRFAIAQESPKLIDILVRHIFRSDAWQNKQAKDIDTKLARLMNFPNMKKIRPILETAANNLKHELFGMLDDVQKMVRELAAQTPEQRQAAIDALQREEDAKPFKATPPQKPGNTKPIPKLGG